MGSIEMYFGETRAITVELISCDEEPFVIRNPKYSISYSDEVEVEGTPILDDHKLTFIFTPKRAGRYTLRCEVNVASETIIRYLPIHVYDKR